MVVASSDPFGESGVVFQILLEGTDHGGIDDTE